MAVSCCTAVADIVVPSAPLRPAALFTARHLQVLLNLFYGFGLGLIALTGFFSLRWFLRFRSAHCFFLALAAALNGAITCGANREYWGPRLMGLPNHHCLHCLLQYRPISILTLGWFVLGSFSAAWPLLLNSLAATGEAAELRSIMIHKLFKGAFACLAASMILTAI